MSGDYVINKTVQCRECRGDAVASESRYIKGLIYLHGIDLIWRCPDCHCRMSHVIEAESKIDAIRTMIDVLEPSGFKIKDLTIE